MLNFPCWVHLLSRPDPTFLCQHLNDLTVCFSYTVFYCVYKATKKPEIWGLISSDRIFTRRKILRGEKYNVCDLHLKPFLSLWNFGECWSKGLSSIACGYWPSPLFCPQSTLRVTAIQAPHQFILPVFTCVEAFSFSFSSYVVKKQFISPPSWGKNKSLINFRKSEKILLKNV